MSDTWRELLSKDHETTERVFAAAEKAFARREGPPERMVESLREYLVVYVDRCHNQKEEKHLFPLLERLGVPTSGGPLAVMLNEHARARELLSRLDVAARAFTNGELGRLLELREVFEEYAGLCKDHFWKENDILYPMATRLMSDEDAARVVRGIEEVEGSFGQDTRKRYYAIAEEIIRGAALQDLSFALDRNVLAAILNTLPVELSFVDAEDTVRYFSHEHSDKIFPRGRGAIGTKVQNCHPQKSVHLVNRILEDFKAGRRDVAEFWIGMRGRTIHIRYWAVRDAGRYLGCLETVQDVTAIQKITGERRLLDDAA